VIELAMSKYVAWARHFDAVGDELLDLAVACGVVLRDPAVVERILKNDVKVCGRKNPTGFRKLRGLLIATFDFVTKAADPLGAADRQAIIDAIFERLDRRREFSTR
jgi:hypothetical protein